MKILDKENEMANVTENGELQVILSGQNSDSGDAIVVTTYEENYGIKGNHYICNCVDIISGNTTESILLDLSTVSNDKSIFLLPFTGQSSSSEVLITFYENTDYSGGTNKRCININRNSTNVREFILTEGATGSAEGDIITEHVAFGSSASFGPFGSSTAGTVSGAAPSILNTDYKYLVTFENTENTETTFECNINIFEIPTE